MTVALPLSEPAPEDWPRRERAKRLLRMADKRGLREALMKHALTLYGAYFWSLTDNQLDELTATFGSFFTLLDEQLDTRDIN